MCRRRTACASANDIEPQMDTDELKEIKNAEAAEILERPSAATKKATTNRTNYTNEKEGTADDADRRARINTFGRSRFFQKEIGG